MDKSGSIIKGIIERVRAYTDEASFDAKHDNNFLTRQIIAPAFAEIVRRLNNAGDGQLVSRFEITLEKDREYYQIPPVVGHIIRVVEVDERRIQADYVPRNEFHPRGPNWVIDGRALRFNPVPTKEQDIEVWYVPGSEVPIIHGTGNLIDDPKTFAVGTVALGTQDRRTNAYAGQLLRVLPDSGEWIEIPISSSLPDGTLSLRGDRSISSPLSDVPFEIVPVWADLMAETVAHLSNMKIASIRGASRSQREAHQQDFAISLKGLRDTLGDMQSRTGKHFDGDTVDTSAHQYSYPVGSWLWWTGR